jgi:hypothetical protein
MLQDLRRKLSSLQEGQDLGAVLSWWLDDMLALYGGGGGGGGGGSLVDGSYGDIIVSGTGTHMEITPGVITLADLQNFPTDVLIGRDTAGTGVLQTLTVSGGLEWTGSGGIQRSALTGDVTAAAGSGATTIAGGVVSLAKMATMATDRLIGRDTAGTGAPEYVTVGGGLDWTGTGGIQIANAGVTHAKYQNIATARLLGRTTGGTGSPEALTGTQATAMLDVFTTSLKGLVPASGGNPDEVLSADGTFKSLNAYWPVGYM